MDAISQIWADGYCVFMHAAWPACDLRPVQTLDRCLSLVSDCIVNDGQKVFVWDEHFQAEAAKLVRMNWTYRRLGQEPIRKPLLTHIDTDGELLIDCGDTRHMAVMLANRDLCVPVVVTCRPDRRGRFLHWQAVHTDHELLTRLGLADLGRVSLTRTEPGTDHAASWMEISSPLTRHHLPDSQQRRRMINNYLQRCQPNLPLDRHWAAGDIDWWAYDS